ncbi:MAG: carboxypeptidase regulatory-like domain-containing protein [Pyrinomonadaceae bacterium]
MLVGDPTASFIYFDLASNKGGMLPSDLDNLIPPPAGTPAYFAQFLSLIGGNGIDAIRIFEFHADFANPSNSTFTQRADAPVAAFDPRNPTGRNDIEQPSPALSTHSLDSIQDRLLFRLQYRNFGNRESLVATHTVNVSGVTPSTQATHRAGVRYYELRRSLPGGSFTVPEQATFAPDTDNRWMGSAAMDHQGNLAIGYSVSSLTTFPSIRYAGRLATDPPNGLPQGETTLVAGTGVQRSTGGRWGDYSSLNVDPADDCTFWYTTEYYTAASQASSTVGWLTRIGNFKFPVCTTSPRGTLQGVVTNGATGLPIPGAVVRTASGFHRSTGATGNYSMTVAPDTYDITASFPGFQSATASGVVVSNGGTTTQNFVLNPIPIIQTAGAALTAESCAPATGTIDPGETVTVDLTLRNVGSADTTNLVATLLPTGGVTAPSGPLTYGVMIAGGSPVTVPFSFTADSLIACGGKIIATLQLQDGANDLGTATYTFNVGTLGNGTLTNNYGTGNIAVPIPDVSMVEIPITVSDTGSISDVNVRVRLNHTFDGDLAISLIHPDGTIIRLSSNRGGAGDNFGSGANDCSGAHTVFDDAASTAISTGTAPFAGSFRPETSLAALNGKASNGIWKLRVADTGAADVGTVGCVQLEISRRRFLCCPFAGGTSVIQAAPPTTVTAESVSPSNGALDPDETVTVNFPLRNVGDGITSNLVATLLPGGGVNAPSGPQNYGIVSPVGPPVSRPFTFVASGSCGGTVTATFHLQDGPTDLGTVTFNFTLGALVTTPALSENFDGVIAPALPTGWVATLVGTTPPPAWATTTTTGFFVSSPNGAATGSSAAVSESRLTSPTIAIPAGGSAQLTFRNNYSLETGFDGGVLEISINGGAFTDIITAGGSFVAGGYNRAISASFQSPIAGRMAWSGTGTSGSSGYIITTINLPSGVLGQNISLRWRAAFDNAVSPTGAGWRIDDVSLSSTVRVCNSQACMLNLQPDILVSNDPGQCGAIVNYPTPSFSGSCGVVTSSPASGSFFAAGTTTVTVTGTRQDASTTTRTFNVTVNDAEAPAISCPSNITTNNDANACSAAVNPGTATATDNCGVASVVGSRSDGQSLNAPYPVGNTTITWTATDVHGNSTSCQQTVTVNDAQLPVVTSSVTQSSLGSPNHNLINVGLAASATDNCPNPIALLSVKVFGDEDDDAATGDGNHSPDAKNIGLRTLLLRTERNGGGDGRVYLIIIEFRDAAGNVGFSCTTVVVPHDESAASINSVNAQAAAAKAFALANNGNPPPGYFVIGDGPILGPKQ